MQARDVIDGRYTLVRQLGAGGFGSVWEARDTRMQRPVALKIAHSHEDPDQADRFLAEALTAGGLSHPHIVTVHDYGLATHRGERLLYLVMELVDGEPLDVVLARGVPPLGQALRWAAQICDALTAAHLRGVVHRDVKPPNVLVAPDDRAKLADFGIARNQAIPDPAADDGAVVGTLAYLAPERFTGSAGDHRSDLYAVGCLLAELVTGRPPFAGPGYHDLLEQHTSVPPALLRDLRPDLPGDLEELVAQLLAKDPADRPQEAAVVRDRLHALAAASGGHHAPPHPAPGVGPALVNPAVMSAVTVPPHPAPGSPLANTPVGPPEPRKRRRRVIAAAVTGVLLAAAGSWLAVDQLRGDDPAAGGAPAAAKSSSGAPKEPAPADDDRGGDQAPSASPSSSPSDADRRSPGAGSSPRTSAPAESAAKPSRRPQPGSFAPGTDPITVKSEQATGYDSCPSGRACFFEGWDGTGWMGYAPRCGTVDLASLRYMVSSLRTYGNPVTLYDDSGHRVGHADRWASTNLAPEESDKADTAYIHCP